jgi:BA14K-like protein
MKDIYVHLRKIRSDAAECLVLGTLASDGKREMFTRIATHLNALALDLEKSIATRTVNGADGPEEENIAFNAPPRPDTAGRPRHHLRWLGIVVLAAIVAGTLWGLLTDHMSPSQYWSLKDPKHESATSTPQKDPNEALATLISTEQVERKLLSERLTALAGRLDTLDSKMDNFEKVSAETTKLLLSTGSTNAETRPPVAEISPPPPVDKLISTAESHAAANEIATPTKQSDAIGPRGCTQFRSFDLKSGTYVTLDGRRRQCR